MSQHEKDDNRRRKSPNWAKFPLRVGFFENFYKVVSLEDFELDQMEHIAYTGG